MPIEPPPLSDGATGTVLTTASTSPPGARSRDAAERRELRARTRPACVSSATWTPGPSLGRTSWTTPGRMFSVERPSGRARDRITSWARSAHAGRRRAPARQRGRNSARPPASSSVSPFFMVSRHTSRQHRPCLARPGEQHGRQHGGAAQNLRRRSLRDHAARDQRHHGRGEPRDLGRRVR